MTVLTLLKLPLKVLAIGIGLLPLVQTDLYSQGGPGLYLYEANEVSQLPLMELKVHTDVVGNLACTEFAMKFSNPLGHSGRGEFLFPIADEEQVLQIKVAVPGPKTDSTHIDWQRIKGYSTSNSLGQRQSFDQLIFHPAWLSSGQNKIFRLGSLEIGPDGVFVRLSLLHHFQPKGPKLIGEIPLRFQVPAADFELEVVVHQQAYMVGKRLHPDFRGRFSSEGYNYRYLQSKRGFLANESLGLLIPKSYGYPAVWFGKSKKGIQNFLVHFASQEDFEEKKKPDSILLFWEMDEFEDDKKVEKDLLRAYLEGLLDVDLRVILTGSGYVRDSLFAIREGRTADLLSWLKQDHFTYESRRISSLVIAEMDEVLLFHNHPLTFFSFFNPAEFQNLPFYHLHSKNFPPNPKGFFQDLVSIDLNRMDKEKALKTLQQIPYRLISSKYKGNRIRSKELHENMVVPGSFTFSGKIKKKGGAMELRFGYQSRSLEKARFRLNPPGLEPELSRVIDLLCGQNPQQWFFPTKLDEFIHYNKAVPALWSKWASPLQELALNAKAQARQYALEDMAFNREDAEDTWTELQLWWQGQYDPGGKLASPVFGENPAPIRPYLGPVLAGRVFDLPQLCLAGDSLYSGPPPAAWLRKACEIHWVPAADLPGLPGQDGTKGLWVLSKKAGKPKLPPALQETPEWQLAPEYRDTLLKAEVKDLGAVFLGFYPQFKSNPSFFIDFADRLVVKGLLSAAVRVLGQLPRHGHLHPEVLRAAAHRLQAWRCQAEAEALFALVVRALPGDVVALRDLALAHADPERAAELLTAALAVDPMLVNRRFPGMRSIVLRELNHLIVGEGLSLDSTALPVELKEEMPLDFRVVLDWNRSDTDMDLWVTDPTGERCFYDRPMTHSGGRLAGDISNGFGPEEFAIRDALQGDYEIEIEYEDDPEERISGPVFAKVSIFTDYGRPEEALQVIPLRLEKERDTVWVARVHFD